MAPPPLSASARLVLDGLSRTLGEKLIVAALRELIGRGTLASGREIPPAFAAACHPGSPRAAAPSGAARGTTDEPRRRLRRRRRRAARREELAALGVPTLCVCHDGEGRAATAAWAAGTEVVFPVLPGAQLAVVGTRDACDRLLREA